MKLESSQQRSLSDLPIGALSHVSSYLAPPSRALFAVALNCHDTDSSAAIVGDQRDALDFGDIEKELTASLTDDDVRNILLSIDAINNLKTLRLTNLLNVTGIGLEPLRGSTMIEKIDLSLVGDNESPDLSPAPPISRTDVLPILDSIIERGEECSLQLLISPKEWRKERDTESEFHAFVGRYNALLRSRVAPCLKCHRDLSEYNNSLVITDTSEYDYGAQDGTCYDCMKHYCRDCVENGYEKCISSLCGICNRRYCWNCCGERECTSCDTWFCEDCMDMNYCDSCQESSCENCISEKECHNDGCHWKTLCVPCAEYGSGLIPCEKCDTAYCIHCYESNSDSVYSIDYCGDCGKKLCGECRLISCKEKTTTRCTGCYRFALPPLLEEKERQIQEMQAEIDKQRNEINQLKRKVNDMGG